MELNDYQDPVVYPPFEDEEVCRRYPFFLKSANHSSSQVINALETYIVTRLIPNENNEWTESAILNLIWLLVESFDDAVRTSANMHSILDKIHRAWNQTLSPEAARSAHVVGV